MLLTACIMDAFEPNTLTMLGKASLSTDKTYMAEMKQAKSNYSLQII